jgi:hypothetical protein
MDAPTLVRLIRRIVRDVLEEQRISTPTRFARISSSHSGTINPRLRFDGEATDTIKRYPYITSYTPTANDRVLLVRAGSTRDCSWVIVGKIANT